jgi:flagellar L-ring protein precursor FlgH
MRKTIFLSALPLLLLPASQVLAQNSSLFQNQQVEEGNQPLTMEQSSWYHSAPPPMREIQLHDIVSIRVDELARMTAEGELLRRKNARYDARLKDWILLDGLRKMYPDPQTLGDPRVQGELRSDYRSLGDLETRESLAFNIAVRVADIRPNGNLVLEGTKRIVVNDETWDYYIMGICHKDAVGPGNVVLSRDLADLSVNKREGGSVAAGYQLGWFMKLFDLIQPF